MASPQPQATAQTISAKKESGDNIFSPEGFIMLTMAGAFDLIGILIAPISNIIAFIFIGGWKLFFRGKMMRRSKKAKKLKKRIWMTIAAEIIPGINNIVPGWTMMVYMELKNGNQ